MTHLKVEAPGFGATVQDIGRLGSQHLGVPVSGALDPISLRLGNALVGNEAGEASIEFRGLGPTLEAVGGSVRLAVTGTAGEVEVIGETSYKLPANQSLVLEEGQTIRVGALSDSATGYVVIGGGLDLPRIYGSKSTFLRGGFGGFEGRVLAEGDLLPLNAKTAPEQVEKKLDNPRYLQNDPQVHVILGPQEDYFEPSSVKSLFASDYEVSREVDRMGMRLLGADLVHSDGFDIISDGIATGAIQVPGNGKPIILLADHQTTGGYPKIGTVASSGLPMLGRARPGDSFRFVEVSVEEAEELKIAQEADIARMIASIGPASPWLDEAALRSANLVSGVVGPD